MLDISFGFGKGFLDDDNAGKTLKFTNGDLSTGASLGWTFWQQGNRRLDFSPSLEYNIDAREPSVSFDLGYGILFESAETDCRRSRPWFASGY